MPIVFFLHYHQVEAEQRAADLKSETGFDIRFHWSTEKPPVWEGGYTPDAVVLSLDRLPSHSRHYAEWLWEAKKRQHIPIIFSGGRPEKIEVARAKFPNAVYCSWEATAETLKRI